MLEFDWRSLLVALALAGACPMAAASVEEREEKAEEPEITVSETVEVEGRLPVRSSQSSITTRLPMSLAETPASLSDLDEELIEAQGAESLAEILGNASGVNVQTGASALDFFFARGFDSVSSSLILTDGAIEPESTLYHLYNVERVEVLKGASGFLYGGRALAGTLNLVRKQPADGSFVRLGGSAGSYDAFTGTVDANLDLADRRMGLRLNAMWQDAERYRDRTEKSVFAVHPSFAWRRGEKTLVNFSLEYVDNDIRTDAGLPVVAGRIADVPRRRSYASPFDFSEQQVTRAQIDLEHVLSAKSRLRGKLYYSGLDWDTRGTLLIATFPNAAGSFDVARTLTILDDRQDFFGAQLETAFTWTTGAVTHELVTGLELSQLEDDFSLDVAFLPSLDVFDPVETAFEPLFLLPGQSLRADSRSRILAPYLIDQIRFSDRFQVVVGARLDRIDFDSDGTASSREDTELSPLLGLVFTPSERLSLYLQRSESFEPPSTLAVGEVRPEEGTQIEAGVKATLLGGRLRGSLSVYELEKENIAIPDATGVSRQQGDQRSRGAELELAATLGGGVDARLAYAYTEAELVRFAELIFFGPGPTDFFVADRSGNTPAFAPENLASLWLAKRWAGGFGLAGGLRYVGEQFIDEDNAFAIDDYLLLDASLSFELAGSRWQLRLDNLTDEEYETRAFGSSSVSPAPGFTARLGFELEL